MRHPAQAILWEIIVPKWWRFFTLFVGFQAFWCWLLGSMRVWGKVSPFDFSMIQIYANYNEFWLLLCPFAFERTHASLSRYDAMPISNRAIATSLLVPLLVYSTLQAVLGSVVFNWLFGLPLPIWNEALFALSATTLCIAAYWQTRQKLWRLMLPVAVLMGLLLFHRSRYGFSPSATKLWSQATPFEVSIMVFAFVAGYFWAIYGVTRCRHGATLPDLQVLSWLQRIVDRRASRSDFRSAKSAQFWLEWRQRGWQLPAAALAVCLSFWSLWLAVSWFDLSHKVEKGFGEVVILLGGFMVLLGSFISGMLPLGADQIRHPRRIGSFVGSRPVNSRFLADSILQVSAVSVGLAWFIWFLSCIAALLSSRFQGLEIEKITTLFIVGYMVVVLLGSWVCLVSTDVLLYATPRQQTIVSAIGIAFLIAICAAIFFSDTRLTRWYWGSLCFLFGSVVFGAAVWLGINAYRGGWVERRLGLGLIAVGCVMCLGIALAAFISSSDNGFVEVLPLAIGGIAWGAALLPILRMTYHACRTDSTDSIPLSND